jgi:hypothetical protein
MGYHPTKQVMKQSLLAAGACMLSFLVGVVAGLSTRPDRQVNHIAYAYGWTALKAVQGAPHRDRLDAARRYVDIGTTATDDDWSLAYKVTRLLALTFIARDESLTRGTTDAVAKECGAVGWVDCSPDRLEQMTSAFIQE